MAADFISLSEIIFTHAKDGEVEGAREGMEAWKFHAQGPTQTTGILRIEASEKQVLAKDKSTQPLNAH